MMDYLLETVQTGCYFARSIHFLAPTPPHPTPPHPTPPIIVIIIISSSSSSSIASSNSVTAAAAAAALLHPTARALCFTPCYFALVYATRTHHHYYTGGDGRRPLATKA
ncbi:hypothetical protein TcWFU_001779 [Taenia crassiceps]|uniref:Uncharacterized protein n=1 Tax=Taenia crassiceps TaxID=6207 RepID=A0ABR4QPH7_9CEST